ncbi:response regulator [Chitinispirillales bacterium ANBcel5]|uniref:response regulator n=1 Tax=Cellulosispirillum alkaliphilum TaxID=3039283 RepID=UPI002A4E96A1|nr:response regulator [Chitinispirillales bacterium ANBcel5]
MKTILVVEDNEDMQLLYKRLFRKHQNITVETVDSGESALQLIQKITPDLMIIDISLPGISGLDLTRKVHQHNAAIKIIIVTGHELSRYEQKAKEVGADEVVSKDIGKEIVNKCRTLLGL